MNPSQKLKEIVRQKYGKIAESPSPCCGERENRQSAASSSCYTENDYTNLSKKYTHLPGYVPDADLGLGCGLPTEFAAIKEGDVVIDLGSGAGNDVFIARTFTGPSGKVIGLDFTDEMLAKAKANNAKLGYRNVEFIRGDIENMPIPGDSANVIISNCVLNLVPDKSKAFAEIYRTLKPGGHFSVSDIVIKGQLPEGLKNDAEMYAGCVSGAISLDDYLAIVRQAGFTNVKVQKQRVIHLPDDLLLKYMSRDEVQNFRSGQNQILSVNVYAQKP